MPLEALGCWEETDLFARDWVGNCFFWFKVFFPDVDFGNTLDAPANAQVDFLVFPVFGEDGAPQGARKTVDGREGAEEEP